MRTKAPQNILVIRPDAMGDCLLITPALRLLKDKFPACRITVLANAYTAPLLEQVPDVDEILMDSNIKGKKFDLSIHFYDEFPYAWLAKRAKIPTRLGFNSKPLTRWLYNRKVDQHFNDLTRHIVEQNCALLRPLGILTDDPPHLQLKVPAEENDFIEKLLVKNRVVSGDILVGIHPTTGKGNKAWLPERYAKVINQLHGKNNIKVVLTGSKNDQKTIQRILTLCRNRPIDLSEKLTLKQLINLISRLQVYVGVDTGPLHIAAAVQTPVVSISPSRLVKPTQWGPWKTRHIVLRKPFHCPQLKCLPYKCPFDDCVANITVPEALSAIEQILNHGGNKDLPTAREDWIKKSFYVLTNKEEIYRELNINGYHAERLDMANNLWGNINQIAKDDINIIHWAGKTSPLLLRIASFISTFFQLMPPLLIFDKDPNYNSFRELINKYKKEMQKR